MGRKGLGLELGDDVTVHEGLLSGGREERGKDPGGNRVKHEINDGPGAGRDSMAMLSGRLWFRPG